ncbi:MAG: NAD-dependent epimerase/dehydratase family protein [Trueperaceae bacterium]
MKTFVTGSTGFLGINLARALLYQGHEVRALARSKPKAEKFLPNHANLEIIEGDMENVEAFASLLQGVEVLFHTAAYFRESFGSGGNHWEKLEHINIKQTLKLFELAETQGVQKVVHVSSTTGIAEGRDRVYTEADLASPEHAETLYARSKILGDRAIAEFLKTHHIAVVTVYPAWMFGPNDAAPTAGGQFVLDYLQQKLPGMIDGTGVEVVDVRDVVNVMLKASATAPSGSRYIASKQMVSIPQLCAVLETASGVAKPPRILPLNLAMFIGWVSEHIARFTGKSSLITRSGLRAISSKTRYSTAKAQQDLGATFRPLEDTMRDAVSWYKGAGYLK